MGLTVVHVLSSFGMGGQERVALDLAAGQHAAGHQTVAVTLEPGDEGPLGSDFRAHGVDVVHLPKGPGFDVSLALALRRLFRERGADVVHTHNPQPLIYGAPAAKTAGVRLVHTKHGVNPDSSRRLWMKRAVGLLADAFVAVSEPTAAVARQTRECRPGRLHVIPNGIDLSRFGPDSEARADVRAELGIPRDAFVVGTVGGLRPEKGHPFFLRAVGPLLGPDLHLVIAGDGPEAARTAEVAAALPVPSSVHLLGLRRDVPRVLAAMDLFALTSQTEGLPLVIPEAMATELPVVSTAVGGIPQVVVDGETGLLVDYGDEPALRAAVSRIASDRELGRTFARRGRARSLSRYSSERMVEDYLALYRQILGLGPQAH